MTVLQFKYRSICCPGHFGEEPCTGYDEVSSTSIPAESARTYCTVCVFGIIRIKILV